MLYYSWDMVSNQCNCYCSYWTVFLPFYPPDLPKKENFLKNEKNAWRYHHFTRVYQKLWSYAILFLRYGMWHIRDYFRIKLSLTSGCCPRWLIFFKNLFYQNNCKEAMDIRGGQIRGALFMFFIVQKRPFLYLSDAALSF